MTRKQRIEQIHQILKGENDNDLNLKQVHCNLLNSYLIEGETPFTPSQKQFIKVWDSRKKETQFYSELENLPPINNMLIVNVIEY